MTTYAVILGRAAACGINTQEASKRVGKWFDNTFQIDSSTHTTYLKIFIYGIERHAIEQKEGRSPDSCSNILKTYPTITWP